MNEGQAPAQVAALSHGPGFGFYLTDSSAVLALSRAEPIGDVTQFADRGDVAIHRIDRFEADELRPLGGHPSIRCARSAGSLWRKMYFSARLLRMPAIIEAWFSASENTTIRGISRAKVDSAAAT